MEMPYGRILLKYLSGGKSCPRHEIMYELKRENIVQRMYDVVIFRREIAVNDVQTITGIFMTHAFHTNNLHSSFVIHLFIETAASTLSDSESSVTTYT